MRNLIQNFLVRLSKKELKDLTTEVKETICIEENTQPQEKRFTSAELWKIQSRKRSVTINGGYTL